MKHTFIREKSFQRVNCKYKEVDWFEYSEEEQHAVRQARQTRTRASPPKIKKLNDDRSRKYFRWLLNNNFGKGDYFITLTFEIAPTKEQAKKEFTNFIRRVRRIYKKAGIEFKYLYVREGGGRKKIHYHLICNKDMNHLYIREEIESCWELGFVNAKSIQLQDSWIRDLSIYLTKSKDSAEKYERPWNCSANLKRPDEVTDDNRISRKRMSKMQNACRNDDVKNLVEKIYKGWRMLDYEIGENPVTGRPFARFKLIRIENGNKRLPKKGKSP